MAWRPFGAKPLPGTIPQFRDNWFKTQGYFIIKQNETNILSSTIYLKTNKNTNTTQSVCEPLLSEPMMARCVLKVPKLHEPRIFYPRGHWPETVTNAHVSAHFRQSLGASVISTHIRTEGLYVKTTIIYQLKRLCVPDCAYTENMYINSIHISLYDISLTQNILDQIKRNVAVWKRLGCPQRNQRTWWQIVATPYTGLA